MSTADFDPYASWTPPAPPLAPPTDAFAPPAIPVVARVPATDLPSQTRPRQRLAFCRRPRWETVVTRWLEIILATAMLAVGIPVMTYAWLRRAAGAPLLVREAYEGRRGITWDAWSWSAAALARHRLLDTACFRHWPAWWSVLTGHLALVGPQPLRFGGRPVSDARWRQRLRVRPGWIGLAWLRERANIDYEGQLAADLEYVARHSLCGDLALLLRALPYLGQPPRPRQFTRRFKFLGLPIDNLTMQEAIDQFIQRADADEPSQICFLNADCVNLTYRHADYRRLLEESSLTLADGIGVRLGCRFIGHEIRQNLIGTDLFPRLCARLERTGQGLFLLGARPGVTDAVASWIAQNYPGVRLCGHRHGYFTPAEESEVIAQIAASGAQILIVALGAPRQELWIHQHLPQLGVGVAAGMGGLFDYYSGRIRRAPQWVRELSLEWAYRLYQEPTRLARRYLLGNGLFLARVCRHRLLGRR